jgi:hypothetical protein
MGSSVSLDKHIDEQEKFVDSKMQTVKNQLRGKGYTDTQIRGKLRQQYNRYGKNNDYILDYEWSKVKL